jgi:V8-like Glu-specific endopeptidase
MRVFGALLLICASVLAPASAPITASPVDGGLAEPLDSAPAAVSAKQQSEVEAYWTDARMRRAARPDSDGRTGAEFGAQASRRGPAPLRPLRRPDPSPVSRAIPWPSGGAVARAVGRVFFTLYGQDYACSATAVRSLNQDTVLTAGHCVNAGPGPYVRNWVFVPGYQAGQRPFGTWTARRLAAPLGWVHAGRAPDDIGFAVLNPHGARHLASVVGGLPIGFGQAAGRYVWAFGYPGAAPYAGRQATFCRGTSRPDPYGTPALGLTCTMTAGSSGGPWLIGFGPAAGIGTVYSVTSFSYQGMRGVIWGPRLGRTAAALYAAAQRW